MQKQNVISASLMVPLGTQVVLRRDPSHLIGKGLATGAVAEIIRVPEGNVSTYGIRTLDHQCFDVHRSEFSILKQVKTGPIGDSSFISASHDLHRYIVLRCVVGSRAYGLSRAESDVDRRGVYVPPAELEWSLYGVPEQLEDRATEECYWELKKFISLALKANPNVLECLFTPIVECTTEIGEKLIESREIFLSKLVYQTYNGYVMSQFKKLEQDLRTRGDIGWKHAMHLIRLLLQGITVLRQGHVSVSVAEHREHLLRVRDGLEPWESVNAWRLALHRDFDEAVAHTRLPDAPNYDEANRILIWARGTMVGGRYVP